MAMAKRGLKVMDKKRNLAITNIFLDWAPYSVL
jgi:hypothetical protein